MARDVTRRLIVGAFAIQAAAAVANQTEVTKDLAPAPPTTNEPCAALKSAATINEYVSCLKDEVQRGSTFAALVLIDIYNGDTVLPPDQFAATYYAKVAADKDDPVGLRILAARKALGLGTEKNWQEALQLRRRQARITGALPPLHVSGYFTGQAIKEGGAVPVEVSVGLDASKRACRPSGASEKLNKMTCDVIMKYFGFLPAVSADGREVDGLFRTVISFIPYRKPDKVDTSIPATLLSGDISPSDFSASSTRDYRTETATLALQVDSSGNVTNCSADSSNNNFGREACQIARSKLKFSPSRNAKGQALLSTYSFGVSLDFTPSSNVDAAPVQAVRSVSSAAKPEQVASDPQAGSDVVLETATRRCTTIGFAKDAPDYRSCVLEQIKILSSKSI